MHVKLGLFILVLISSFYTRAAQPCCSVTLQVLGSGGPELDDGRTSTSYLIWVDGKARLLIDTGPGSSVAFGKSKANFADLSGILLTHLHVDHAADLPAYVKGSFFTSRDSDLKIFGPAANSLMPATSDYVKRLLAGKGAFRYLQDYVDGSVSADYQINTIDVNLDQRKVSQFALSQEMVISALPVFHGPVAAVSWRVDIGNRSIVISGDMSGKTVGFGGFAKDADLLVMHNAIPEQAGEVAKNLHMTPSEIGQFAQQAKAKKVIVSHRMKRTNGQEAVTSRLIKQYYSGPIEFAEDMDKFTP